MDWAKASTELAAKLDHKHVKSRSQAGRTLDYIEGWWAIAEANRIFGFDGWTRETVEIRMVSQAERKVGKSNPRDGWSVSYIARVRIVAGGITREGVGAGHGIDTDLGLAHESAIKEAETDGMKRGLMTFGYPLGLALYDKEQTNVTNGEESVANAEPTKAFIDLKDALHKIEDQTSLNTWIEKVKETVGIGLLKPSERALLQQQLAARRAFLAQAPGKAA